MSGSLTAAAIEAAARPPVAFLLAYAFTVTSRVADQVLRPYGVTLRQFGILAQLEQEPELTMSELARQHGISRQSLHELTVALENAGYLSRLPGASGRTRKMALTARAGPLLAQAREALRRNESRVGLNPAEVETLRQLLRRLLAHATDDDAWL